MTHIQPYPASAENKFAGNPSSKPSYQELVKVLEETTTCLNQCLGIIVEFGDLNGFRNLSDQDLGKAVITMSDAAAAQVNAALAALAKAGTP